jgi:hypothetical protein
VSPGDVLKMVVASSGASDAAMAMQVTATMIFMSMLL